MAITVPIGSNVIAYLSSFEGNLTIGNYEDRSDRLSASECVLLHETQLQGKLLRTTTPHYGGAFR